MRRGKGASSTRAIKPASLLCSAKHGAPNALRKLDRDEVVFGIKVIFARLVDNAD
jgi:hypothetical protein